MSAPVGAGVSVTHMQLASYVFISGGRSQCDTANSSFILLLGVQFCSMQPDNQTVLTYPKFSALIILTPY